MVGAVTPKRILSVRCCLRVLQGCFSGVVCTRKKPTKYVHTAPRDLRARTTNDLLT
jgi:hypothetical protein